MTFWVGLIYLLITQSFTLPYITVVCILAYLTTTTRDILYLVKDIIDTIIARISNKLQ